MEVFVQSINYPMYMLSTEGRVFSRKKWRFLKNTIAKRGFIQVSMDKNSVTLHYEMAMSFANSPVAKAWIKNNDKSDCRLSNIDWALANARPQIIVEPQLFTLEEDQFKPLRRELWTL
jgi:hypothetical protein